MAQTAEAGGNRARFFGFDARPDFTTGGVGQADLRRVVAQEAVQFFVIHGG